MLSPLSQPSELGASSFPRRYLMHRAFEAVCIYKPAQSRPANSERYLICRGMRSGGGAIGEHLLAVNDRLNELKPDWPCSGKGSGGRDVLRDLLEFAHQLLVDGEPARRVVDDRGEALPLRPFEAPRADRGR